MRSKWSTIRRGLVTMAVFTVALGACGGDDSTGSSVTGDSANTTGTVETPDSTSTPDTAATPASVDTTEPAPSEDEPVPGGTLTYGWVAETPHMFPAVGPFGGLAAIGAPERMAVYDALAISTEQGEVEYRLAEGLETDDGGLTWQLKLRAGLVFSDGTPLDATAVKYNWDDITRPGSGSAGAARFMAVIASTSVVDATTLSITLAAPNPAFPRLFAQSPLITIGSPTAMQAKGEAFGSEPVGAGPFLLEEWVRGDHMTFVKNPSYHGEVYLDSVVFRPIPDDQQRLNTLTTGGLDVVYTLNTRIAIEALDEGFTVVDPPLGGGGSLLLNQTRPPFDDVRARLALTYAIDSEALNGSLYEGKGQAVRSVLHPDSLLYSDVSIPSPDAAKAQELFDELAGEGKAVEFVITSPAGLLQEQSNYVQAVLAGFDNVQVTVQEISGTQASEVIQGGNFDAIHISQPKFVDPYPSLSNAFATGGSLNYGKYSDERMDAALSEAQLATDPEARIAAYEKVQQIFAETAPVVITLRATSATIYDPEVVGAMPTLSDGVPDWARAWKQGGE